MRLFLTRLFLSVIVIIIAAMSIVWIWTTPAFADGQEGDFIPVYHAPVIETVEKITLDDVWDALVPQIITQRKSPFACYALNPYIAGSAVASDSCDDCSGDLIISFPGNSLDVTSGSPCGCADGDTTGTAYDSCSVASGYVDSADAGKYIEFGSNINPDELKVVFEVYVNTWNSSGQFFHLYGDADNYIQIRAIGDGSSASASDLRVYYRGAATSQDIIFADADIPSGQWVRITYNVKRSESSADHSISIDRDLDGSDDATSGTSDDVTEWEATPKATNYTQWGNPGAGESDFHLRNGKVYATSDL